ncbi:MAG: hypothetical protein ACLFVO_16295 [Chloroflexaceae bacterium]
MGTIRWIHATFGEMILPLLIVIAAIWFTVSWKPDQQRTLPARIFPILVDIQFVLGLIYWIYGIAIGRGGVYLGFPFILHPILGLLAVGVAHLAVRSGGPFSNLGRWRPLAGLGLLLVIVLGAVVISTSM